MLIRNLGASLPRATGIVPSPERTRRARARRGGALPRPARPRAGGQRHGHRVRRRLRDLPVELLTPAEEEDVSSRPPRSSGRRGTAVVALPFVLAAPPAGQGCADVDARLTPHSFSWPVVVEFGSSSSSQILIGSPGPEPERLSNVRPVCKSWYSREPPPRSLCHTAGVARVYRNPSRPTCALRSSAAARTLKGGELRAPGPRRSDEASLFTGASSGGWLLRSSRPS